MNDYEDLLEDEEDEEDGDEEDDDDEDDDHDLQDITPNKTDPKKRKAAAVSKRGNANKRTKGSTTKATNKRKHSYFLI